MKHIKKLLAVSILALCSVNYSIVNASEHDHSFEGHRCSCGAYSFEAEDGQIGGTCSDSEQGFVLERNSSNSRPTSGGKCVGNWSTNGNSITWKFALDKASTSLMHLFYAPGSESAVESNNAFSLKVNGKDISFSTKQTAPRPQDHWYEWSELITNETNFVQGNNIIVLQNIGYSANIDNLVVDFSSDITISSYQEVVSKDYKVEAESCDDIKGTPTYDNPSLICSNSSCSGGGLIGNWGNGDDLATWYVNSSEEVLEAKITFYVVAISGQINPNDALIVRVNGQRLTAKDSVMPSFDGSSWHDYKPLAFNSTTLIKGKNKIELEANSNYAMNIDYFVINTPDNITLSRGELVHTHAYVDNRCSCGAYSFEAENGEITGICTDNNDGFVLERNSSNSRPTSGGKCVGNWSNKGNKIIWKFSLDKETKASMNLYYAPGMDGAKNINEALSLKLNNQEVSYKTTSTINMPQDHWYEWTGIEINETTFNKGNNVLVLENLGYSANIDNLEVFFDETVNVSSYVESTEKGVTYKFEAEDGTLAGTPRNNESTFIVQNEKCSNGKCVGNFGDGDNQVFWYLDADKDVTKATIKFYVAAFGPVVVSNSPNDAMWVEVNEERIFSSEPSMPSFDGDYYKFQAVTMNDVSLKKGSNTIKLEGNNYYGLNIDYMEVVVYNNEVLKATTKPDTPIISDEHVFVNGICSDCGAYSFEAEDAVINGECSDPNEGFILERASTNTRPTSEGKCVGNFSNIGNSLTWNFSSNKDNKNIKLSLWVAPCGGAGMISDIVEMTLNGKALTFDQTTFPGFPGGDSWYSWRELTISNVDILSGENEIVFTNKNGAPFNIDNLVIGVDKETTLTRVIKDKIAPTISVIEVLTNNPKANEKVEFNFDYEDNKTSKDNLIINISVFYKYGVAGQKRIEVNNNSFIPLEAGEYTIIVTVSDEENNVAERTRILNVIKNDIKPNEDVTPDKPSKGLSNTAIASITLGSVCLVVIGLGVYVFIKYKLRMRG